LTGEGGTVSREKLEDFDFQFRTLLAFVKDIIKIG
jgi:hypothetical protein